MLLCSGEFCVPSVIQSVRKQFPSVQQLATHELASWLADSTRPAPFLVDARSAGEFSVSHLRVVANLTTVNEVESLVSPSRPVVVYCSVGISLVGAGSETPESRVCPCLQLGRVNLQMGQ